MKPSWIVRGGFFFRSQRSEVRGQRGMAPFLPHNQTLYVKSRCRVANANNAGSCQIVNPLRPRSNKLPKLGAT